MEKTPQHTLGYAYLLGLAGVIIFGSTLPVTRLALAHFSPSFITFGRAALATLCAAAILILLKRPFPRDHVPIFIVSGIMVVAGFPLSMAYGLQTVPAAHGGVVLGVLPLLTAVLAAIFAGERLPALFWIAAVAGAGAVTWFSLRQTGMHVASGDIWLLVAALAAALGYVGLGRMSRLMPGWEAICWALVLSSPLSLIGTVVAWQPHYADISWQGFAQVAYLGLFSQFIGFFAWNTGMARGGIARIGQLQLLQTFVTLAMAASINGETVGLETVAFAIFIALLVWIGGRSRIKASKQKTGA